MVPIVFALAAAAASPSAAPPAPPAAPPCAGPEYRSLDFWTGEWDGEFALPGGGVGHATNRITKDEFGACVISEHFRQGSSVGASFSTFDRLRKKWVQTWVDDSGGYITLIGGPVEGQPYSFRLDTIEPRGPAGVYFRMIWQDVRPDSFTWRWQSRQPDGSYADAWVIRYTRRK